MDRAALGDRVRFRPYLEGIGGLEAVVIAIDRVDRVRTGGSYPYRSRSYKAAVYILELDDGRRRRMSTSFDVIPEKEGQ